MSGLELANRLKNYFVSVTSDDPALDYLTLPAFLPAPEELPVIRPTEVYKKLLRLSPFKACGPDAIPNRILKLFASELSDPVTTISNRLPSAWRDAYISPIPKASPVTCDNDLRPVALTACLSKHLLFSIPSLSERMLCEPSSRLFSNNPPGVTLSMGVT